MTTLPQIGFCQTIELNRPLLKSFFLFFEKIDFGDIFYKEKCKKKVHKIKNIATQKRWLAWIQR